MRLSIPPISADRFERLFDWLYPPRCRACGEGIPGREREVFCAPCRAQLRVISHPLCAVCGRPFPDSAGDDRTCGVCLARPPHFSWARSWVRYPREEAAEDPLRRVVQKFKYGRKVSLGKPLGRLLALGCREFLSSCEADLIMPVPLHPQRLRWRGFNQSLLLARQVGRAYGVPVDPFSLQRSRPTPPQTQLSEEERRKNMRGAFAVRAGETLAGRAILLIDDVYTSGATVNECSRTLKKNGAKKVFVLTLARAL